MVELAETGGHNMLKSALRAPRQSLKLSRIRGADRIGPRLMHHDSLEILARCSADGDDATVRGTFRNHHEIRRDAQNLNFAIAAEEYAKWSRP